jgi:hypothetical protein
MHNLQLKLRKEGREKQIETVIWTFLLKITNVNGKRAKVVIST